MSINVFCQTCGKKYQFPESEAGAEYECQGCKATVVVPGNKPAKPPKSSSDDEMMDCPFCSEPVKKAAKKCKHCGETIDVALRVAEEARREARKNKSQPNVYMNAGGAAAGGGGGSSASSSSSSAAAAAGDTEEKPSQTIRVSCLGCLAIILVGVCVIPFLIGIISVATRTPDKPKQQAVAPQQEEKKIVIVEPPKTDFVKKEIEKKKELPKVKLPPSIFTPILSAKFGNAKVDLIDGNIGPVAYKRKTPNGIKDLEDPSQHLIMRFSVTNIGDFVPLNYAPWHAMTTMTAKDEHGKSFSPWFAGAAAWPANGLKDSARIELGKTVLDVIAFTAPPFDSQEIDIRLPSESFSSPGTPAVKGQWLVFKIGREFFKK